MIWRRMKTTLIVGRRRGNDILYLANVLRFQRDWLALFTIAEQVVRFENYSHERFENYSHESRAYKIVAKRELL